MIKVGPKFDLVASVRCHAWPSLESPFNLHVEATVSLVKVHMVPSRRPSICCDPVEIANLDEYAADKERRVNDGRSARVVDVRKNCVIAMRATGSAQKRPGPVSERDVARQKWKAQSLTSVSRASSPSCHSRMRPGCSWTREMAYFAHCEKWRGGPELSRKRLRRTSSQCHIRSTVRGESSVECADIKMVELMLL